jgi:hypothetical protein
MYTSARSLIETITREIQKMIGAMIVRRMVRSGFEMMNRGDVDSMMVGWADDAIFDYPSIISVGGTLKGKKEIKPMAEVYSLDGYDLAFIGSPIQAGQPAGEAKAFLERGGFTGTAGCSSGGLIR